MKLLFFVVAPIACGSSVFGPCILYAVLCVLYSFAITQLGGGGGGGRESLLFDLYYLLAVMLLLLFLAFPSRCRGVWCVIVSSHLLS